MEPSANHTVPGKIKWRGGEDVGCFGSPLKRKAGYFSKKASSAFPTVPVYCRNPGATVLITLTRRETVSAPKLTVVSGTGFIHHAKTYLDGSVKNRVSYCSLKFGETSVPIVFQFALLQSDGGRPVTSFTPFRGRSNFLKIGTSDFL